MGSQREINITKLESGHFISENATYRVLHERSSDIARFVEHVIYSSNKHMYIATT